MKPLLILLVLPMFAVGHEQGVYYTLGLITGLFLNKILKAVKNWMKCLKNNKDNGAEKS